MLRDNSVLPEAVGPTIATALIIKPSIK